MQTAGANEVLAHSESDESLLQDLQAVVNTPAKIVSRAISSRAKQDRLEIHRILGHLPVVREARASRHGSSGAPAGAAVTKAPSMPASSSLQLDATSQGAPHQPRDTAVMAGTALTATLGVPPRTPRAAALRLAVASPRAATPRGATPRGATPRGAVPRAVGAASAPRSADGASPEFHSEPAKREATQRVVAKLAEIGIDPQGMTAADLLQTFYARGSGSSYWLMNRDAEKRLSVRAQTPQSFGGVLTARAHDEVRRARDLPPTHVHECLDRWEVDTLAEVCRSLRHFDDVSKGPTSEYMRMYAKRDYGVELGRKKIMRPPT
mmetsp:Transcript_9984/g.31082  ORF Transcript_9984/g.31082 Transcript_9984/m.31082 type:complete len:322 (+) Transcript_9984:163-1128(+)